MWCRARAKPSRSSAASAATSVTYLLPPHTTSKFRRATSPDICRWRMAGSIRRPATPGRRPLSPTSAGWDLIRPTAFARPKIMCVSRSGSIRLAPHRCAACALASVTKISKSRSKSGNDCGSRRRVERRASTRIVRASVQLEQLARIIAPDLGAIGFADRTDIEPLRGVIDILERPVCRKHDAVRTQHQDRVDQRLGLKIPGGGDVKVAAEIIAHPLLRRIAVPILDQAIGVVDPPHR